MKSEDSLLKSISSDLKNKHLYLATAESCTGGLLGHWITNLPGSSDFYLGGQIAYSNHAKELWLKVPHKVLETFGAVSKETVLSMANGIRQAYKGKVSPEEIIGFSISGIAGPSGGSPTKPVGTVWMGYSSPGLERSYHYQFKGPRTEIKIQSALTALEILADNIHNI